MTTTFKDRMKIVVDLTGTAVNLAKKTAISPRAVGTYLSGESLPGLDNLVAMAKSVGISVHWLATGEGPMRWDFGDQPGNRLAADSSTAGEETAADQPELQPTQGFANLTSVEAGMVEGILTILRGPRTAPLESVLKHLLQAWEEVLLAERAGLAEKRGSCQSVPGR